MTDTEATHIFISAGEASGDLLGANLAKALLEKNPALNLTGMGGARMRDAGVSIKLDPSKLSVVGLSEVFTHLPSIIFALWAINKYLRKTKPDLVILIDFPDTHFRVSKMAKMLGIPVLYYVSPQIWAWRYGRIKHIKKYIDRMAVLFSFEEKMYQKEKMPVDFVGHPLVDIAKTTMTAEESYPFFNCDPMHPIVTLFPGSREGEISRHLPIIIEATNHILKQQPNAQFILMLANHVEEDAIRKLLPDYIKTNKKNLYDLLQISDAAIAVSGTVTLEIGLMQVPMCILYQLNAMSYYIATKVVSAEYIGLCNIVAENMVAKEFIQADATPENIAAEILKLLSDQAYHADIKMRMAAVRRNLGPTKAADRTADVALEML